MKSLNSNQNGFGFLGIFTLVLVMAIGIGTGWYVYDHNHKNSKNSGTSTTVTQNKSTTSHTTSTSSTEPASNGYAVPELGIQMTLPSGLSASDLQYVAQTNIPGTGSDPTPYSTASFTTKSLLQLDNGCTAAQDALGIIEQLPQNPGTTSAIHVGNYYYTFSAPQSSCSANKEAGELELSQTALLNQAFETTTAKN